jgi:putative two-component system response regulator
MALSDTKQTVLVVDDVPENIDVLNGILRAEYKVLVALEGAKALAIAASDPPPDLILLDIMMPGMDGYEVCRRLKGDYTTRRIPVIFVTAKGEIEDETMGFELGAVDYITKPVSPPIVRARVRAQLALYDQNRVLEEKVQERTAELNETRLQIIQRLGRAAEYKDNETGMHVIRMSHYAKRLGLAAGMDEADAELLLNAAPMHDIGKIGIPDRILQKRAGLDAQEWATMRQHPEFGAEILGEHASELLAMARVIALSHHEKWDGSGYPKGLKGDEIPLVGRIVAIADVFDALTTARPYKSAWSVEEALAWIQQQRGSHFDPDLVDRFAGILPELLEIKGRYGESGVSWADKSEG